MWCTTSPCAASRTSPTSTAFLRLRATRRRPRIWATWARQAQWNPNYLPYFWRDIWPILRRPYYYQYVMDLDAMTGGDPHQSGRGSGGNMDPDIVSIPPFQGENPEERQMRAKRRMFVYQMLRKPGGENSLTVADKPRDAAWHYYAMPYLCGDNPLSNVSPSKFLRLTDTMLFILKQWAEGKFINERSENLPPEVVPQGEQLDRGSLGNVLGGAFCPGAEACWILRNPAIYSGPYRINQATPSPGALSQPLVVANTGGDAGGASLSDGLEPGDITKYDAVPWQADFNECSTQPIDITYEQWNNVYPDSTGDPVESVQQLTYWWPAHRPMEVSLFLGPPKSHHYGSGDWSPTSQNHAGDLMMVTQWANLGFVLKNPAFGPGNQVDPEFVNVPSGNSDDLPSDVCQAAYDVAILGGGPAGTAAALSLKRLRPALCIRMVEASRYAEWRVGETLSPGTQQLLAGLGCWDRFLAERFTPAYGTRAAWGAAEAHDNEFLFSARGDGWHVDRVRFDAMLCACVREAGVEVTESARLSGARRVDGAEWSVAIRGAARREEFRARFVVDATGRSAAFATGQGARRLLDDRLVGVFVLFRFPEKGAAAGAYTLVEAHPDGWWYSSITPDSRAVVAWMSDASLVRRDGLHLDARWMERLGRSRETAARVAGAIAETAPVVWAAHSQRLSAVRRRRLGGCGRRSLHVRPAVFAGDFEGAARG